MAKDIFDKFNESVDLNSLKNDIANSNKKDAEFKDVPVGEYEVKLVNAEVRASSKGDPMATLWFKIVNGEYKGNTIFFNQVIREGFQINIVDDLLRSLETGLDIYFDDYRQYHNLLLSVVQECENKLEFALEYGVNAKGFNTYKITEVFDI